MTIILSPTATLKSSQSDTATPLDARLKPLAPENFNSTGVLSQFGAVAELTLAIETLFAANAPAVDALIVTRT